MAAAVYFLRLCAAHIRANVWLQISKNMHSRCVLGSAYTSAGSGHKADLNTQKFICLMSLLGGKGTSPLVMTLGE